MPSMPLCVLPVMGEYDLSWLSCVMILPDRECHKARDAGGRYGRSRPRSVLDAQGVAVGSIRTGTTALRFQDILDRLHPIGFSRGGV